ncbi:MAG TPA: VWA domain-containing protein [Pyrinomonadaceae bacterium]|nr:VWA domain-containing protein [Pyrinomonadaceae bacterium]
MLSSRRAVPIFLVVAIAITGALAQTRPTSQKPNPPKPSPTQPETPPEEPQDIETVTTETDLVTVPLIANDSNGTYITDLRQDEFAILEDGVQQPIAFFGKVAAPFHVVLMLDTSSSTQDKLRDIQQAAFAFVQQLQDADRVKVISFDDKVNDLNEFTSDRETLRSAIYKTRSGQGTKVYDAMELAMNTIRRIRGRKAIVIFTDGMDWHSDSATFEGTLRWLDEEGVVVYPIRYETRATTERLAREQSGGSSLPTIDVIRNPTSTGTTAPTFPSDNPVPTTGTQRKTGPLGLPLPEEILRRRREEERNRDPNGIPPERRDPGNFPEPVRRPSRDENDSIKVMLDLAYATADGYLRALAEKSGGRLLRADTLKSLPAAFAQIAAELRTQYMLGYYPINKERDERYRKIKVTTTRKHVVIRARPGYLATNAK